MRETLRKYGCVLALAGAIGNTACAQELNETGVDAGTEPQPELTSSHKNFFSADGTDEHVEFYDDGTRIFIQIDRETGDELRRLAQKCVGKGILLTENMMTGGKKQKKNKKCKDGVLEYKDFTDNKYAVD